MDYQAGMVVHYGSYGIHQIDDREELFGSDAIVPHRVLKNHVIEQTGIKSYALFSEAAAHALRLREYTDSLHDYTETYEHIGEVKMAVYDLNTAWEREKAKRRKVVTPEEPWVKFETDIAAPPSLVWDYLTSPRLKPKVIGLDFTIRTDDLGGRIREEAKFHCAHGDIQFHYKIVDWKPFDYFTIHQKENLTGLEYYETYFFVPTENGTHFMSCVGKPEGDVPPGMQEMVQGAWDQAYGNVKSFIEQDMASKKITASLKANAVKDL